MAFIVIKHCDTKFLASFTFSQIRLYQTSSENKENSAMEVTGHSMSLPITEVRVETGLP